jgi:alkanesulfonate monooxygenase SsuD/methylene tetrahydromethanopterin reductase-like flavin-dependent oxidoreductase (luciferase family)
MRLMRALWTQEVVTLEGRYHRVTYAGINPLPVQRPIPIWIGGGTGLVVRRIGRISDGWFPQFQPDQAGQERIDQMRQHAKDAGRDPLSIGIEGRVALADRGSPDDWRKAMEAWAKVGATHLSVNTMKAGLKGPDQHIDAIRRFKEAVSG